MRCLATDDPLLQDRKSRYILQCHRQTIQCHHWLAAGDLCAKTYTSEAVAERKISSLVSGCSTVDINTRIVWYSLAAVLSAALCIKGITCIFVCEWFGWSNRWQAAKNDLPLYFPFVTLLPNAQRSSPTPTT